MELTDEQKNKLIQIRTLLKKNAPSVYTQFAASKLSKHTPILETPEDKGVKEFQDFIDKEDIRVGAPAAHQSENSPAMQDTTEATDGNTLG